MRAAKPIVIGVQFDRPLVKCYKSAFCAAFAPRHRGASPAIFGGSLQPARGRFFLVECEQFALRSRQTALSRKSVPEAVVPASNCPVNKRSEEHTSELQSRLHLVC